MRRFKVTYRADNDTNEASEAFVVADKESKALKAFHLKVQGVDESDVLSIEPTTYPENVGAQSSETDAGNRSTPDTWTAGKGDISPHNQSSPVLGTIGIILMIIGGVVLIDPTVDTGAITGQAMDSGMNVTNIHLLIVGQTATLVGAIFVAVQWRPR